MLKCCIMFLPRLKFLCADFDDESEDEEVVNKKVVAAV